MPQTQFQKTVESAFARLNDPTQNHLDRTELKRIRIYTHVMLYIYAYKNRRGKGNEIDLMLESANGNSYDPIRYTMGVIAYDISVSKSTLAATRRAYNLLRENGYKAHSDYLENF